SLKYLDTVRRSEMINGKWAASNYEILVVMNNVIGKKFKLIKGYGGSVALRLAMERGEIEGFCGVGYNSMRTAGLADGKANILVPGRLAQNPHMPNVSFIFDYSKSGEEPHHLPLVFGS